MRLAINAVSFAPGGALTGLLGYLSPWMDESYDLDITIYASRRAVLDLVEPYRPRVRVVPFAVGCRSWHHFLQQQMRLGPVIERNGAEVLMATNTLVGRCQLPQLVHHRKLALVRIYPGIRSRYPPSH